MLECPRGWSPPPETKHFVHPELGPLELICQTLLNPVQSHSLLVYTARSGSESHEKRQLLYVLGAQSLRRRPGAHYGCDEECITGVEPEQPRDAAGVVHCARLTP